MSEHPNILAPREHRELAKTLNQEGGGPPVHPDVLVSETDNRPLARQLRQGQEERQRQHSGSPAFYRPSQTATQK